MSFRQFAAMLAATTAIVAPAAAQTQVSVNVDGKNYTVTELPGRTSHMVQLAGPEGTAMVMVDKSNNITMFASPPGGGTPQQQALIKQVWTAYLERKNGTASASPAPANEASDPNAARRADLEARAAAINAQARGGPNGAAIPASGVERVVKSLTADSITVYDPTLKADVTFTDNLMKATWSLTPPVPAGMPVSPKTESYNAHFEGGDKPASALQKSGKWLKGAGVGVGNAANHSASASSTIAGDPDKVWSVDETTGGTRINLYQSGGMRVGGNIGYSGRDPKGDLGKHALVAVKEDLDFAQAAIETAQQSGQATGFNLAADRFQRGKAALQAALN